MKLLKLYSLATGLSVGKQHLVETFYPLPFVRYVTIQGGSGMAGKNYPHYNEVISLLADPLKATGITLVQIGGKDDPALPGCHHLQGLTNLHQSNYVLARSLCHIGNDSWLSHRGGYLGVPLVVSFGPTSVTNHSPYQFNPMSVFIESHRFGRRPTFAAQEPQSTMAVIPPEQIANGVLRLLFPPSGSTGGQQQVTRQSLYFGEAYHQHVVELVPDSVVAPQIQINTPLVVRMDLVAANDPAAWTNAESMLAGNLQLRKCLVVTDRELNLNILAQLKPNVVALRVEVDRVSAEWIKAAKRLGISTAFFSSEADPVKLASLRLALYDVCLFDHFIAPTKTDFLRGAKAFLNRDLDMESISDRLLFKTNKPLLAGGKIYLTAAHWKAGQPTPSSDLNTAKVIDDPLLWQEIAHLYLFTP